jgi:hypothetical protein
VSDSSATQCGSSCLDCSQPNANAACAGTICANACVSGYTLGDCGVDTTGHPSCSLWDFESNDSRYPNEGWVTDTGGRTSAELATYGPLSISSAQALVHSHSLALPIDVPDAQHNYAFIKVPLCLNGKAIDISSKSIGFDVRFVTAPGSANPLQSELQLTLLYTGPDTYIAGLRFTPPADVNLGDSPWYTRSGDIQTNFNLSGTVTALGFAFSFVNPWKGTIYIDDVMIY